MVVLPGLELFTVALPTAAAGTHIDFGRGLPELVLFNEELPHHMQAPTASL